MLNDNDSLTPLDFGGERNGGKKEKMDLRFVRAASYRELGHWVAILDLDGSLVHAGDRFSDWLRRCGIDVREVEDDGGLVLARPGGSFFFLDPTTVDNCEAQFIEVRDRLLDPSGGGPSR